MRFIRHLTEVKRFTKKEFEILPQIVERIKRDCAPFLKEMEKLGSFIYRGNKKSIPYIRAITPREDRRPSDMPEDLHEEFDDEFFGAFRWRPRSSGVFTTFNKGTAKNYGNAHLFFPIGRYKYVWSPTISDLWNHVEDEPWIYEFERESAAEDWESDYGTDERGTYYYKGEDTGESDYTDALNAAERIEVGKIEDEEEKLEAEIEVDEFLLEWVPDVSLEDFIANREEEYRNDRIKGVEKAVATFIESDLRKAVKKSNEIIFKCKRYYLVNGLYEDDIMDGLFRGGIQMELPFKEKKRKSRTILGDKF